MRDYPPNATQFRSPFSSAWSLPKLFNHQVADFGLAKFISDTDTHITTPFVMGTHGYLGPEYAHSGKLTDKSDIYSYGVVLLELITGRQPIGKAQVSRDDNLVEFARPLLKQVLEDRNFDSLADPTLKDYDSTEMTRIIACAEVCLDLDASKRPRMSQIVCVLEGAISLDDLKQGGSTLNGSHGSSNNGASQFKEDQSIGKPQFTESTGVRPFGEF